MWNKANYPEHIIDQISENAKYEVWTAQIIEVIPVEYFFCVCSIILIHLVWLLENQQRFQISYTGQPVPFKKVKGPSLVQKILECAWS